MKKLFGNMKMSWLTVLLFAVAAGVYTGLIMLVPALKETSFQDIGISYEWWVVFAVTIVVNCKKGWEAMLKCFVFFLVSQPLVYLVEIAFGTLDPGLAWMYYRNIWLPMTILTLPGGLIAYYCKKQSYLGAVILGIGNTIQMLLGIFYLIEAVSDFPHHLLSSLFCFASMIVMSVFIQHERKYQLAAIVTPVVLSAVLIVFAKMTGRYLVSGVF